MPTPQPAILTFSISYETKPIVKRCQKNIPQCIDNITIKDSNFWIGFKRQVTRNTAMQAIYLGLLMHRWGYKHIGCKNIT